MYFPRWLHKWSDISPQGVFKQPCSFTDVVSIFLSYRLVLRLDSVIWPGVLLQWHLCFSVWFVSVFGHPALLEQDDGGGRFSSGKGRQHFTTKSHSWLWQSSLCGLNNISKTELRLNILLDVEACLPFLTWWLDWHFARGLLMVPFSLVQYDIYFYTFPTNPVIFERVYYFFLDAYKDRLIF